MSKIRSKLIDLIYSLLERLERAADASPQVVNTLLLTFPLVCFSTLFMEWVFGIGHENNFSQLRLNYQGGFVRRGLLGELVWHMQHLTNIPANYMLAGIFAASYAALATTVLSLLTERVPRAAWRTGLFLAPVGVLFAWQDSGAFMRAEVLALLLLAIHARFAMLRGWPLAVLLSLSVLVHELQILLLPFHALLLLKRRFPLAPLLLPIIVCGITAMNIGNPDIAAAICASWNGQGCPAALTWGFRENFEASVSLIGTAGPSYFFALLIGLAPAVWLLHSHTISAQIRNFWWLAVGASAGLFLSGCDFGRWINVIALHGLLVSIALARGSYYLPIRVPPFVYLPTFRWCIASGYGLLWYVPHVGSPGLRRGMAYRYLSYSQIHEPLYWALLPVAFLPLLTLLLFWRQLRQLNAMRLSLALSSTSAPSSH